MTTALDFAPNRLYYGDCLDVLRGWPAECVDLVYLDPPFNSKADYNILYGGGNGIPAQVRAFTDTWHWDAPAAARMEAAARATARPSHHALTGLRTVLGESGMLAYLTYMAERLEECRRVMRSHAGLYLHCDPTASHYLKVVCDGVFGPGNFRNELIWRRTRGRSDARGFGRVHDTILYYCGSGATWNPIYLDHDPEYVRRTYRHDDPTYGPWRAADLTASGLRSGESGEPWRGIDPGERGNHWRTPTKGGMNDFIVQNNLIDGWPDAFPTLHARLDALDAADLIYWPESDGGMPCLKRFLASTKGNAVDDVIIDIKRLEHQSREALGYPTQKPVALLSRLIKASSNPDDVVLDPFCGCGTTVAAAELTRRRWVGIDISPFAVKLVRDRRLRPMGRDAEIAGIPTDMEGARMLLERSPLDFEAWAVTAVPGLAPNERRVGDRGIDGRGAMMRTPEGESTPLVLAQVKGGGYTATTMRDFQRVIDRESAAAGIYITLRKTNARGAHRSAAELGTLEVGAKTYPKLQLWSVEELLEGRLPNLPDMADPYTGKRVRQAELFE